MVTHKLNLKRFDNLKNFCQEIESLSLVAGDRLELQVRSSESGKKTIYLQFEVILASIRINFPKLISSESSRDKFSTMFLHDYQNLAQELTRLTCLNFAVVELE